MKPDLNIVRDALILAIENDSKNNLTYAKAKWELDRILTYRPSVMEALVDIREKCGNLYDSINTGDVSESLEHVGHHIQQAIDAQHAHENREDDTGLEEYHDNQRKERGEWQ